MGHIRKERLDELSALFVKIAATATIAEIRAGLTDAMRWVVVEFDGAGRRTWAIATAAAIRRTELDVAVNAPIGTLPQILRSAITLKQSGQGIGEARWRAWRTLDRVVAIVDDGEFVGLVGFPDGSSTRGDEAALPESRFLRAKVEALGEKPVLCTTSFVPDTKHRLTVSVGPHQEGLLVAETAVPPAAIATPQMVKITAVASWITSEGQMFVPETGASSECVLDLGTPPPGPQRVTILLFSASGLVQTATLIGECALEPTGPPLALVIDAALAPNGAAVPTLVADTTRVVATVPTDSGFDVTSAEDLEGATKGLYEELEIDIQGLWIDKRSFDDPETIDVLRKLARSGVALRGDLFDRLPAAVGKQFSGNGAIQLVVRDKTVDVPLELFYDAPTPRKEDSVLCPDARDSLAKGTCAHCEKKGSTKFICPMGFWGLRRVIERRVVDSDGNGTQPLRLATPGADSRPMLASLDTALVAHSARVEAAAVKVLMAALRSARIKPAAADNWDEWSLAVSGEKCPPLLIIMPHVDQTGLEPRMEIGDSQLERVDISSQYVCPPHPEDAPGPLVLLLGCETAKAPVAHRTMTSKFLTLGASIVVGTRMPVVAEAAPIVGAAIIRSLIAQSGSTDVAFGDAVRRARCELLADGHLVALTLVALGDGGWRVPTRKAS